MTPPSVAAEQDGTPTEKALTALRFVARVVAYHTGRDGTASLSVNAVGRIKNGITVAIEALAEKERPASPTPSSETPQEEPTPLCASCGKPKCDHTPVDPVYQAFACPFPSLTGRYRPESPAVAPSDAPDERLVQQSDAEVSARDVAAKVAKMRASIAEHRPEKRHSFECGVYHGGHCSCY